MNEGADEPSGFARWLANARESRFDPLAAVFLRSPAGQLARALYESNVRDRALTLAGQAFIALVVLASWLSSADGLALAAWLIDRFRLSGTAASAVEQLFQSPPSGTAGISFLGLVILLISVNSFARSLRRTYEAAWHLPGRGRHRTPAALAGAVVLMTMLFLVADVAGRVGQLTAGSLVLIPVQLACAVPGWWLLSWLMVSGRVTWRRLFPGAVISSVVQALTAWGGSIWVPLLIERDASRYGVIGVAVALTSWLVVLAFVVVTCAVAGAWVGSWWGTRGSETPGWARPDPRHLR